MFLNESAANKRMGDRKQSWVPIGIDCEVFMSIGRSEQWSILLVLTVKGYISYTIFQGVITSELFKDFVEH